MKKEEMNKIIGMLDDDVVADGLSENRREGITVRFSRKVAVALIAATLAVALLASGIIAERAQDVIDCFEANGYRIVEKLEDNGWCGLAVMKK